MTTLQYKRLSALSKLEHQLKKTLISLSLLLTTIITTNHVLWKSVSWVQMLCEQVSTSAEYYNTSLELVIFSDRSIYLVITEHKSLPIKILKMFSFSEGFPPICKTCASKQEIAIGNDLITMSFNKPLLTTIVDPIDVYSYQ